VETLPFPTSVFMYWSVPPGILAPGRERSRQKPRYPENPRRCNNCHHCVAVGGQLPRSPRTDPGVRLSRTGLLSKVERDRSSGLGRPTHLRSVGSQLRGHADSGTVSGARVATRLSFDRPPSLHHLRRRLEVGLVRGFTGTMQPSDSSSLPRRLRLFDFPT
jgi:hypothetical protein